MAQTLASELGKRRAFDVLEQEATLNIARTAARLSEPFDRLFREHGVSAPLYNILRIVRGVTENGSKNGVPSGDIAGQMISPAPDVTRLVDRLVKLGMAVRQRGDEDRRVVFVRLAPPGRRLLKRLDPLVEGLHQKVLGGMSRSDLRQINELMVKARRLAVLEDEP